MLLLGLLQRSFGKSWVLLRLSWLVWSFTWITIHLFGFLLVCFWYYRGFFGIIGVLLELSCGSLGAHSGFLWGLGLSGVFSVLSGVYRGLTFTILVLSWAAFGDLWVASVFLWVSWSCLGVVLAFT